MNKLLLILLCIILGMLVVSKLAVAIIIIFIMIVLGGTIYITIKIHNGLTNAFKSRTPDKD